MTQPIPFRVLRYRCPHCPRTASRPVRIREHMARCWTNPDAKGCKTCKHFTPYGYDNADECAVGIDLTGRPECKTCGGRGETFDLGDFGASECVDCGGDGTAIKPGPIVGCDRWEATLRCQEPTCPDFGDPDFGEATCPAEHADPRPAGEPS